MQISFETNTSQSIVLGPQTAPLPRLRRISKIVSIINSLNIQKMQIKSQLMSVTRAWGDGSAGKVLAAKSWGAEFRSTTLTERPWEAVSFSDPSSEGQGTDRSQGPSEFSAKHKPQSYPGKTRFIQNAHCHLESSSGLWLAHLWALLFINLIYFF